MLACKHVRQNMVLMLEEQNLHRNKLHSFYFMFFFTDESFNSVNTEIYCISTVKSFYSTDTVK